MCLCEGPSTSGASRRFCSVRTGQAGVRERKVSLANASPATHLLLTLLTLANPTREVAGVKVVGGWVSAKVFFPAKISYLQMLRSLYIGFFILLQLILNL